MQDRLTALGRTADWSRLSGSLALVGGLVVAGYAIATLVMRFDPYYAIAAMLCVVLGVVIAYKPELGVFCYFAIAPYALGKSPEIESRNSDYSAGLLPSELLLGFLLAMWLGRRLLTGNWKLAPSGLNKPMVALGAVVIASFACSQLIYDPTIPEAHHLLITQLAETGLFLLAIGAFFLAANSLVTPKWINALFYPMVFVGLYAAAFKLTGTPMIVPTPKATLVATVAAGYIFARLLFRPPGRLASVILWAILILCAAVPVQSHSWISGLIAMGVVMLTLLFLKSRKAFAYILVVLAVLAIAARPVFVDMYKFSEETGDFDRFGIWGDAARMAWDTNPVLGVGPGNFYPYSFRFGTIWYGRYTYTTAHNNYAQAAAEMGLLGLAAFVWLIVAGLKTGLGLFRKARADLKWLPAAATAILAGFAASSLLGDYMFPNRANGGLLTFGISVYVWLTMGAAVSAGRVSEVES
ncbi:MAG: O-antigen ligase family protein [Armatimonadota bacterium]|nr:O-antigen ligase family protein [Armatimonadota bacterium]